MSYSKLSMDQQHSNLKFALSKNEIVRDMPPGEIDKKSDGTKLKQK